MKKSRVLWQNNTEFEQILPLEQFFKYHFSSATFYMFVIAYLPRWLSLTTRVVKVNHKGD